MTRLEFVVLLTAALLMIFVIEVVRRRRLSESYALLWIGVGVVGILLGLARPLIDRFSEALGVSYGTNLVFAVVILFLLVVCINLSMHVSRLEDKVEALAQEVTFLRGPAPGAPAAGEPVEGPDDPADAS